MKTESRLQRLFPAIHPLDEAEAEYRVLGPNAIPDEADLVMSSATAILIIVVCKTDLTFESPGKLGICGNSKVS